jgi:hypothetical protein
MEVIKRTSKENIPDLLCPVCKTSGETDYTYGALYGTCECGFVMHDRDGSSLCFTRYGNVTNGFLVELWDYLKNYNITLTQEAYSIGYRHYLDNFEVGKGSHKSRIAAATDEMQMYLGAC